jgi:hypothetical protein
MRKLPQGVVKELVVDAVGVIGLVMLSYGCWLISPKVMYIIIGTLLMAFAVCAASAKRTPGG